MAVNQIERYLTEFPDDHSLIELDDAERGAILAEIEERYGLDLSEQSFWVRLKDHRAMVTGEGVGFLDGLLAQDASVVMFDCEDFRHGYATRFADAARVIGESSYFEYLIYAIADGRLIVENDHNELFIAPGR